MTTEIKFNRFFSIDSPKAIKAQKYGYINAINYMAPHKAGGVGNLCPHASPVCIALCLGMESGQAGMRKEGQDNSVTLSRKRKAVYFMHERAAYMAEMAVHIAKQVRYAKRKGKKLVVRPNGASDIAYEGLRMMVTAELASELKALCGVRVKPGPKTLFEIFPSVQFVDYTKNPRRFDRALPANYDLTFSRAEDNEAEALRLLERGINVAVVFAALPERWHGFDVIDGDAHDLRHLDKKGCVVGLLPKGRKAKADRRGFVVREG